MSAIFPVDVLVYFSLVRREYFVRVGIYTYMSERDGDLNDFYVNEKGEAFAYSCLRKKVLYDIAVDVDKLLALPFFVLVDFKPIDADEESVEQKSAKKRQRVD